MTACTNEKAAGLIPAAHDYLYIYRIPVHSEHTWFNGIRLNEPHDDIISGGKYYDSFAAAARAYLNDRWKGEQPILIARDAQLNEIWRWGPQLTISNPNPSPDLPF